MGRTNVLGQLLIHGIEEDHVREGAEAEDAAPGQSLGASGPEQPEPEGDTGEVAFHDPFETNEGGRRLVARRLGKKQLLAKIIGVDGSAGETK
jgi:hypothetical protein